MTKDEKAAEAALAELSRRFPTLRWDFRPDPVGGRTELISQWLGDPEEEVMLCAFTGDHIDERFHRQDSSSLTSRTTGRMRRSPRATATG